MSTHRVLFPPRQLIEYHHRRVINPRQTHDLVCHYRSLHRWKEQHHLVWFLLSHGFSNTVADNDCDAKRTTCSLCNCTEPHLKKKKTPLPSLKSGKTREWFTYLAWKQICACIIRNTPFGCVSATAPSWENTGKGQNTEWGCTYRIKQTFPAFYSSWQEHATKRSSLVPYYCKQSWRHSKKILRTAWVRVLKTIGHKLH